MTDKTDFILRFILFAAFHSLFAADRVKKMLHGVDRKVYRLCYNIASLVMFGWVMAAYRHSEVLYFVPGVWSLIMYLLQLVVLAILVNCLWQTGIGAFFGLASHPANSLTTTGWYSFVRHPLYLFSILFMVLTPVMTLQWLMLTIMSTLYFVAGGVIEERRLEAKFGEAYRDYRKSVPFIIPRLPSTPSKGVGIQNDTER